MSNPPAWPGLAHFVEHMLFLGTDRFREGEFEQFIGVNGGTNNAYTETEDTTYFFDVIASSLPGALDRFSDFFVSPLFTESATGREVSAIESEHQKNVPLDSRRLDMLLRIRAHPSHPYSRFTTGNRQTLRDGDGNARAALLDFYRDYYTAPQMSLSLTGPQSLDELQRLAVSRFGRVGGGAPTSLPASISYDGLPPPFAPGSTTALQAVPVRDVRSLTLTWCVPIDGFDFREWVQTKPEQLLVNLLSSRVAGTPWQFLKRNGFASNVEARVEELTRSFVLVSVYAGLTEQGLAQWDDVATIVFSYLRALRDGVPSHWFSEARAISRLAFEYAEPATPRAFVTATSGNLPLYPPREWLTGPAVIAPGAERALAYLIDSMRPTTLAATTLVSKAYASRAKLIEPIYGTKYVEIDIAPQVAAWEAAPNIAELHAPNPNPFIPTRLGIKAAPRQPRLAPSAAGLRDGETHPSPTLLTERPGLRLFHLQDSYFRRPKAFAFFALRSPALYTSPAVSVQAEIYQSLLTDVLQDTTFQASQAGLTVSTSVGWRGLDVFLGGYDQNLPRLASLVASTLRTVPLEPSAFESAREKLGRQLANLDQRGSYELVRYRRSLALEAPRYANSELAAAAKLVTLDDLKAFQSGLLSKTEAEAFITGNVRDEEAAAIVQQLHEALPSQPLPQEERPTRRVRRLPLGKTLQQFVTPSTTEGNSAIEVYYQIGQDDGDRWVVLSLLAQLMNKPFYASLRTRQQLGYIVQCGTNELFGVRALTFTVQSATASPQLVEERIDEFVRGFRRSLLAVGDEEVASLGERLSKQYLDVDARLDSQAGRLWTECLTQRYDFERPWELSTKARRITPAALLDFYDTYIADDGSQMRCLSTHVFSRAMAPPRTQLRQPRVPDVFYDPSVDLLATRNVRRAAAHSTATEASDAAAASGTSRSASAAASPSRARPLVMRMATPTRRAQARRVAAPVMVDAAQVWSAYEAAAESNSLVTDIVTNGVIHVISDSVAQLTECSPLVDRTPTNDGPDLARVGRFGAFGSADGAVSHAWFVALDAVVGESGTWSETLVKVAADQLVYTPLFCVWFLAAFVVLEGRPVATMPRVLREEWFELFRGNAGFFLPLTGLIYGYVPRDERVLAFGAGSLVYTWILSLWNSARGEARAAAGTELCSLATDDECVPEGPAPPRARALLSVGVRRTLVSVRRRARPPAMQADASPVGGDDGGSEDDRLGEGTDRDALLPQLLDEWTRMDDGRYRGMVDGRTLWMNAASVEDGDGGAPTRIRSLNGDVFELGSRLGAPLKPELGESLYELSSRRQTDMQRGLSFAESTWPTLAVFAILTLSNAYGVVPGTCIGPAATSAL